MPKASPAQTNFNGGEISELYQGRVESDLYRRALAECLNYQPTLQGALVRRPGSRFIAAAKSAADDVRLEPYQFSVGVKFMLEFGDGYIRFYRDYQRVMSGLSIFELATPYDEQDVKDLVCIPTPERMYVLHPFYPPRVLVWSGVSDVSWSFPLMGFADGPYEPREIFAAGTTFALSGTSGVVALVASDVSGVNQNQGFQATDEGRHIRLNFSGDWVWVTIVAVIDTLNLIVSINSTGASTSPTNDWRLGLWSNTTGWPATGVFHEDRLVLAGGTDKFPLRIDFSRTGEYFTFSPTAPDGSVPADYGLSFRLWSSQGNEIAWLTSGDKGLLVGTEGGEWVVGSPSGEALSAASPPRVREAVFHGSAFARPVQLGNVTLFLSRTRRQLRELGYHEDVEGFRAPDRTIHADHIGGVQGFKRIVAQQEPFNMVWGCRKDGVLAAMTYERTDQDLIDGWSRYVMGGESGAKAHAKVIDVAVMSSNDGLRDEIWLVVKRRRIVGPSYEDVQYIEVLTKVFDQLDDERFTVHLDSSLTHNNPQPVVDVQKTGDTVTQVEVTAHGFSDGDQVVLDGMNGLPSLDRRKFLVANAASDTFEITNFDGSPVLAAGAYSGGGVARQCVFQIAGLQHLAGMAPPPVLVNDPELIAFNELYSGIGVWADGARLNRSQFTLAPDGVLTLRAEPAAVITAGLIYASRGKILRPEAGAADGAALGKTRRTNRIGFLLFRTGPFKYGLNGNANQDAYFRSTDDSMSEAPPLFSGVFSEDVEGDYTFDDQVTWQQEGGVPGMVLAVMPQMTTQDR